MKPKPTIRNPQKEMFRVELVNLVDLSHPLLKLGERINWTERLGITYNQTAGAPGINTRLMVALHYLKYQYDLSDEGGVAHWVEIRIGSISAAGSILSMSCRLIHRA